MAATGAAGFAPAIEQSAGQRDIEPPHTAVSNRRNSGLIQKLSRTLSGGSQYMRRVQSRRYDDSDDDEEKTPISKADDWKMLAELQSYQDKDSNEHVKGRKLGVTWTNLMVKGVGVSCSIAAFPWHEW